MSEVKSEVQEPIKEPEVVDEKPVKRYRLLTRAQIHGAIREPGYIFPLAEGELGPHRTVVASNHGAQITDHMNATQDLKDVPMYEEYIEPEAKKEESKPLLIEGPAKSDET